MKTIKKTITLLIAAVLISGCCVPALAYNEHNSRATAIGINTNQTVYGSCSSMYDTVYYSFSTYDKGYIYITTTIDEKKDERMYIDILDTDGERVQRISFSMVKLSFTSYKIGLPIGDYYLVYNSTDSASCEYQFCINFIGDRDWEGERNNELSKAESIAANHTYYGTFNDSYDTDCYCLYGLEEGDYQVQLSTVKSGEGIKIRFFDENGNEIDRNYQTVISGSFTTKTVHFDPGDNYISISISNSDELCHNDYSFTVYKDEGKTQKSNDISDDDIPSGVKQEEYTPVSPAAKPAQNVSNQPAGAKPKANTPSDSKSKTAKPASDKNTKVVVKESKDESSGKTTIYVYNNYLQFTVVNFEITIVKYVGNDTEVNVPSVIQNKTVTGIGESAFEDTVARTVTIPDTVTKIDKNAFSKNSGIQLICSPDSAAEEYAEENGFEYVYIQEEEPEDVYEEKKSGFSLSGSNLPFIIIAVFTTLIAVVCIALLISKSRYAG